MGKKIKIVVSFGLVFAIILVLFLAIFFSNKARENSGPKIKSNVKIITSETEHDFQPISVTDDLVIFTDNPKYKKGDIIVAGIIEAAPSGFIRKVISVSKTENSFEYKTEDALLTDVFEEAHIIKTFAVTDEKVLDVNGFSNGVMTLNLAKSETPEIQFLTNSELSDVNSDIHSDVKIQSSKNGLGVIAEIDTKFNENFELKGQVEFDTYLEIKIDIEDEEIDFGMAVHTDTIGDLFVGCEKEMFDKNDIDNFSGEYEKSLLKKTLPNIQFLIGTVPIVITNEIELLAEISAQLEGEIGTTIGVNAERISGFEYNSKSGSIEEINQRKYLSDGIEWNAEGKTSGELEAGIYTCLISKLYGNTGVDLSVGMAGNVEGKLDLGMDEKFTPVLYGNLVLSVEPKVGGKIVVTSPLVDADLVDAEILKVTLPAFWQKEWKVPDPILLAMQKGNFSCFAGKYIATSEDNNAYGGGENLNPLELNKDGSLTGGGAYYYGDFYPKTPPISVEKNEDGTYLCTLNENSYYIIYPVGVIEEREYVMENQAYLRDVVYIRCFVFDGGVLDVTYYLDNSVE